MNLRLLAILGGILLGGIGWNIPHPPQEGSYKAQLSEYGFFTGDLSNMLPAEGVLPYDLNTPLFSDYARKARFVRIPSGSKIPYNDSLVLDFPVGTEIVKTFYYPIDARNPDKGRKLIETRILIREEAGWKALPYVWDEQQTDAFLDVAGARKQIQWKDEKGKKQKLDYVIPNMNQCKGCHLHADVLTPIGPSARQLNGDFSYGSDGTHNQLQFWAEKGMLNGLPAQGDIPSLPDWDNPQTASLENRARAYLDINCGHCHNPKGPANTSGLYLDIHTQDPAQLGILKSPIAAGRGSGGRKFDIDPGNPNSSILVFRMESEDPGVMMPELSRKLIHQEGIQLIRDWISEMKAR